MLWINTFLKNRISQFLPFDLQEQTLSVSTKYKYQKLTKISKKYIDIQDTLRKLLGTLGFPGD